MGAYPLCHGPTERPMAKRGAGGGGGGAAKIWPWCEKFLVVVRWFWGRGER